MHYNPKTRSYFIPGILFKIVVYGLVSVCQCCFRKVTLNALGRRHGKSIMIVENIESMEINEPILIDSDDGREEMDTDEPAQKKSKQ